MDDVAAVDEGLPSAPPVDPTPAPADSNPFGAPPVKFSPVDHDPFNSPPIDLIPVSHDPPNAVRGLMAARLAPKAALEGGATIAGDVANALASKSIDIYNFPAKPPRPFSADYLQEPATDATGRLKFDIEGRPLVAPRIVGRGNLGGADEALTPAEFDAVGTAATGRRPQGVSPDDAGGAAPAGWLSGGYDSQGQKILRIFVDRGLSPDQKAMVVAHETGHAIDHLAGAPTAEFWNQIPQTGLRRELNRVFSAGSTGEDRTRDLLLPRHFGYSASEVPAELMAEGIRAYMTNPNYLKTVAPGVGAAIRAAVNSHPVLSRIIQFNGIPALAATGAAGYRLAPVDHDPFAQ
jgi:hypothetical protein